MSDSVFRDATIREFEARTSVRGEPEAAKKRCRHAAERRAGVDQRLDGLLASRSNDRHWMKERAHADIVAARSGAGARERYTGEHGDADTLRDERGRYAHSDVVAGSGPAARNPADAVAVHDRDLLAGT